MNGSHAKEILNQEGLDERKHTSPVKQRSERINRRRTRRSGQEKFEYNFEDRYKRLNNPVSRCF